MISATSIKQEHCALFFYGHFQVFKKILYFTAVPGSQEQSFREQGWDPVSGNCVPGRKKQPVDM
jgi:hypothetical protein